MYVKGAPGHILVDIRRTLTVLFWNQFALIDNPGN